MSDVNNVKQYIAEVAISGHIPSNADSIAGGLGFAYGFEIWESWPDEIRDAPEILQSIAIVRDSSQTPEELAGYIVSEIVEANDGEMCQIYLAIAPVSEVPFITFEGILEEEEEIEEQTKQATV